MLLKIASLYPDYQDIIEVKISNQLKVWSDFLTNGQYQETLTVIAQWYIIAGRSEKLVETIDYIRAQHAKKRNLIKELDSY
jgi:hypothetical protein